MPTPTIPDGKLFMNATLYTGNGSTQTITNGVAGQSFQPDYVWIKARSAAIAGLMYDSVRGATIYLQTNSPNAEGTGADSLTAFTSNGFTVGADTSTTGVNQNGTTYVGWQWKAGGTAVSNTDGTITSSVSANTTSGFSVVTYTGTGSAATIGHGLGAVPRMVIVKNRDAADAWQVYHAANTANPETDYLVLNTNAATADAADRWDDTLPTSTVFSIGNGVEVNTNTEDYVAYCWAEIAGYSAFGSYTGNGSTDGPFVYTGFRPAFLLVKRSNAAVNWYMFDSKRNTYNAVNLQLSPNLSNAESSDFAIDFLSNGFKLRIADSFVNGSGDPNIYMAFAENPFKYANAR
jgi:hypothetical protein